MVTAQQRYSQTTDSALALKQRKATQYRAEKAYYETDSGKAYLKQQARLASIKSAIAKIKAERQVNVSDYESKGYTSITNKDGSITLKAPSQTYRAHHKDDFRSSYTPMVIVMKDGLIVSRTSYSPVSSSSGHSKSIKVSNSVTYSGEGNKIETYYKSGKKFRIANYKAGQYTGGKQYEAEHWGNKYWEAAHKIEKGQMTEKEIAELPEDIKESGYVKDVIDTSELLTQTQYNKAKVLTPEAQMKEYGRVIYKTPSRLEMEAKVRGVTVEQLKRSIPLTSEAQKAWYGKEIIVAGGMTQKEFAQKDMLGYSFISKGRQERTGIIPITMFQPEVVAKMEQAIKNQELKQGLRTMDFISAGGVPEQYKDVTPQKYKILVKKDDKPILVFAPSIAKERVTGAINKLYGVDKNESRTSKAAFTSTVIMGGVSSLYEIPKSIKEKALPLLNPNTEVSLKEFSASTGKAILNVGEFFYTAGKGTVKSTYSIARYRQKLRTGLDTQADKDAYERLPSSLKRQYPTYESYKQRLQKGNIITQKADVILKPSLEEKVAAGTVLGLGAVGLVAPSIGVGIGKVIVGGQVARTLINPSPENVGTTIAFIGLPYVAKKIVPLIKSGTKTVKQQLYLRSLNKRYKNALVITKQTLPTIQSKGLSTRVLGRRVKSFDLVQVRDTSLTGSSYSKKVIKVRLGKPEPINPNILPKTDTVMLKGEQAIGIRGLKKPNMGLLTDKTSKLGYQLIKPTSSRLAYGEGILTIRKPYQETMRLNDFYKLIGERSSARITDASGKVSKIKVKLGKKQIKLEVKDYFKTDVKELYGTKMVRAAKGGIFELKTGRGIVPTARAKTSGTGFTKKAKSISQGLISKDKSVLQLVDTGKGTPMILDRVIAKKTFATRFKVEFAKQSKIAKTQTIRDITSGIFALNPLASSKIRKGVRKIRLKEVGKIEPKGIFGEAHVYSKDYKKFDLKREKREFKERYLDRIIREAETKDVTGKPLRSLVDIPKRNRQKIRRGYMGKYTGSPLVIPPAFMDRSLVGLVPRRTRRIALKRENRLRRSKERVSFVKRKIVSMDKVSFRERKTIRKEILGRRSINPLVIPKPFMSRPLVGIKPKKFIALEEKQLRKKQEISQRIWDARKGLRPLTSIPKRERRLIKKKYGYLRTTVEKWKPIKPVGYGFPIEGFIKKVEPWQIIKKPTPLKDMVASPSKKKVTKDIIRKEYKEVKGSTGTITLVKLEKPITVTKTKGKLKPTKKLKTSATSNSEYINFEVSSSMYAQVPVGSIGSIGSRGKTFTGYGKYKSIGGKVKQKREFVLKQKSLTTTKQSSGVIPILIKIPKMKQAIGNIQVAKQGQLFMQQQESLQLPKQSLAVVQDVLLRSDVAFVQESVQAIDTTLTQKPVQKTPEIYKERIIIKEEPFIEIKKPLMDDTKKGLKMGTSMFTKEGYDVMVKRKMLKVKKGVYKSRGYKKVNKAPLTKDAAEGLGMSIVDKYTNRSFTVKKANKYAQQRSDLETLKQKLKSRFRKSKVNSNIIVEKITHAISSPEEKNRLYYERIKQKKQKKALFLKSSINKAKKEAFGITISQKKARLKSQIGTPFFATQKKKAKKSKKMRFI